MGGEVKGEWPCRECTCDAPAAHRGGEGGDGGRNNRMLRDPSERVFLAAVAVPVTVLLAGEVKGWGRWDVMTAFI